MLATCNRVKLYAAAGDTVTTQPVAHCLARREAPPGEDGSGFYRYEGEECVRHLFRVVCGLDSTVIGETEILGQVKKAYTLASESGRRSVAASSFSTRPSCGEASAQPDGDHPRFSVGRVGGGRSRVQDFPRSGAAESAPSRRGRNERAHGAGVARAGRAISGEQSLIRAGGMPGGICAGSRRCVPALAERMP